MPMLLPAPSLTLSPASTTSANPNHRPFPYGLLSTAILASTGPETLAAVVWVSAHDYVGIGEAECLPELRENFGPL
jgi:hypothetical protein